MMRRLLLTAGFGVIAVLAFATSDTWRSILSPLRSRLVGRATVQDRLDAYGEDARSRLRPLFEKAGVVYPPGAVTLVGLKQEKQVQLYAADPGEPPRFIRSYDVLAASGKAGPKLAEGDLQVPEGLYRIESLNPNSSYHLSLRVDYPNQFDRDRAREEGRTQLGGDIMITARTFRSGVSRSVTRRSKRCSCWLRTWGTAWSM